LEPETIENSNVYSCIGTLIIGRLLGGYLLQELSCKRTGAHLQNSGSGHLSKSGPTALKPLASNISRESNNKS
jgi:hypothetical protein